MSANQQQQGQQGQGQQGQTASGYSHQAVDGQFNISPVDTYDPSTGVGQAGVAKDVNLNPTGSGTQHGAVDGQFNITPVDKYNPQTGQSQALGGSDQGERSRGVQYGGEIQDQQV